MSRDVNDPAKRDVVFLQVRDAYREQVDALIDGGADLLLCETVFDTLVLKACLFAIEQVFADLGGRFTDLTFVISEDLFRYRLSAKNSQKHDGHHRHNQNTGNEVSEGLVAAPSN